MTTTTDRTRTCKATDPHTTHGWKATLDGGTRFRVTCPGVPTGAQAVAATVDYLATPEPEATPAVDYTTLTRAALRFYAKQRGLTQRGTTAELAARLTAADQA